MRNAILAAGIILFLLFSCVETEPVSTVPQITYESFELYGAIDTSLGNHIIRGVLEFSFIDGDADIGMEGEINPLDTVLENKYNLFLMPFEKVDTNYYAIEQDTLLPEPNFRITRDEKMDRTGQNKTIKGTITVNIDYYLVPQYDTMRYEFYILDRAKNKSNVETTDDIGFKGIIL